MRILAVTNMYPTERSPGRGVFVREQVKGLEATGLEVRVLFLDRLREGPSIYYHMESRLTSLLQEFAPHLVHVMYGGVMARQVLRHHHCRPTVVTFHGSDLLGENLSGWKRRLISRYGVWCSRAAARAAEGIVVVARHLLRKLPRAVYRKARVLPCGIDFERFQPADQRLCQARLGWASDRFHVLFASSNGDPVKRPWLAKAAVAELMKRGVPAELHCLAGVPNGEVPHWLNAADVLLLTSRHEGSPTVVKEALACELPVVSVDVGDVAERLEGIPGCYLAEADAVDLADKLTLVRQRSSRLDCRAQLQSLSVLSVGRQLQGLYQQLLVEAPRAGCRAVAA